MKQEHVIKNFEALASSVLRRQALFIMEAGLQAINTKTAIYKAVTFNAKKNQLQVQKDTYDLSKYKKVICIGFGKASKDIAISLYEILGEKISKGYFIGVEEWEVPGKNYTCRAGTHPLSSQKNLNYTQELTQTLEDVDKEDLVICVVSGGGSALLCAPFQSSVEEEQKIFKALTKKGASIQELNTVRKHTNTLKGGQLIKYIYPATCVGLVFSDVPGNDISVVASGPTVKDPTTTRDALVIVSKYNLLEELGKVKLNLIETPKEESVFSKTKNYLLVSSEVAMRAMREQAEEFGFEVDIFSEHFQGNAGEIGKQIPLWRKKKGCVLGAGESTVIIKGQGEGGRNLEVALSALNVMPEQSVLITTASDGRDNTDAAGAIADNSVSLRAKHLGLNVEEFLQKNDSYNFFEATGDLVFTGLTGSNVSDLFVFLKN